MKWSHAGRSTSVALVLIACWVMPAASQQTGRITGTVVDGSTGRPLPGVQVFVPPTGIGGLTDRSGRYVLLNVPAGSHTVTAQLIGFRQVDSQVTVRAGEVTTADMRLAQTAINLEEIVVTGAGIATERRKLGNSIATIDASAIAKAPITDFSQILQGREPGVTALPTSGFTGEGARIRIRGSASLSQLNEPIVYVDGIRVDNSAMARSSGGQASVSRLDDIPPDAIERIEILKGAAAATLFGTEASNGVIQIFTKKGTTGAPRFTFQSEITSVHVPNDRMAPMADFARSQTDVDRMNTRWGTNLQPYQVFQQDLLPQYFETGIQRVFSGSVTGGGGLVTYFISGRFQKENGPLGFDKHFDPVAGQTPAQDQNQRVQSTANITITPHDKVRIGVNTMYSEVDHETPETSNNIYGLFSSALMSQLRLATESNLYGAPAFATTKETMYQINSDKAKHFAGSANVNYAPIDAVRLDGTFGVDFVNSSAFFFRPFRWAVDNYSSASPEGFRGITETRNHTITSDFKLSWETAPTQDITNTFLAGTQGFLTERTNKGGSGSRFPGPGLEVASAGADQSVSENWVRNVQLGGYLQDQIGWQDYAFLTLGGRWDANSAFGEDFNTAFYPKVSLSVMPADVLGWDNETVSTIRVRGAIGRSGLQPSAFDKFTTFAPQPSSEGPGVRPANLGNDALRPEISTEWELGSELGLFSDRASFEVTYWNRTVKDAIVARQFPVSGGFIATQADNIGQLSAYGYEVGLRGNPVQRSDVTLSLFVNGAFLREKIDDLGGAPPLKTGGSYSRYRNYLVQGYSPGAFFAAEVARDLAIPLNLDGSCTEPTRQQALAYFANPVGANSIPKPLVIGNSDFGTPNGQLASHNCGSGALLTYMGKPTPDWSGAFGFNLGFLGNFELSSMFEYKAGNFFVHDLSGEFRRSHSLIGRNTPRARELEATLMNPASTAEQRLDAAVEWATAFEGLAPLDGLNSIKAADFVRWRELALTYNVPMSLVERVGVESIALNVGARNLKMWLNGDYPGMEPEGNVLGRCNGGLNCNFLSSTEGWGIPVARRLSFSTRVSF